MTTPAQAMGIIENVTHVTHSDNHLTYVCCEDDGTRFPFFTSVCGNEVERCFDLHNITVVKSPKFQVGQELEVAASGWGLAPQLIGKRCIVESVAVHSDRITYKVTGLGEAGTDLVSNNIWEESFKAVTPAPLPVATPQTPAQAKGINLGKVVRLTKAYGNVWKVGDLIKMTIDDNTREPRFEHCETGRSRYIRIADIELLPELTPMPPLPVMPQGLIDSLQNGFAPARMITINLTTDAEPMPYTPIQKQALDCFNTMHTRAVAVRNGESISDSLFYTGYGICDNISRCKPTGSDGDVLATIKDNLIRRVASYSGNYHYPVSCPTTPNDVDAADTAWSRHNNKWTGAYGTNRLVQLEQLIDMVKNHWTDALAKDMTPAARIGLVEGLTIVQWKREPEQLYRFVSDDRSSDPYFERLDGQDRRSIDIRYITIMPMADVENDSRSVADFLQAIKDEQQRAKDIELQIAALQKELSQTTYNVAMLDHGLRVVHKVKRLDK